MSYYVSPVIEQAVAPLDTIKPLRQDNRNVGMLGIEGLRNVQTRRTLLRPYVVKKKSKKEKEQPKNKGVRFQKDFGYQKPRFLLVLPRSKVNISNLPSNLIIQLLSPGLNQSLHHGTHRNLERP